MYWHVLVSSLQSWYLEINEVPFVNFSSSIPLYFISPQPLIDLFSAQ